LINGEFDRGLATHGVPDERSVLNAKFVHERGQYARGEGQAAFILDDNFF